MIDTLKSIPVRDLTIPTATVSMSFVDWLPFWLRIVTMIGGVIYIFAKAWNEIKKNG